MKYNVGDKIRIKSFDWYNENKDEFGDVEINSELIFYADRSKYCGEVFTISKVFNNHYFVKEDNGDYFWTDEMIECLVERNGKTYPYKIGDRVVLKGNNRCATITDLKYNSFGNLSYYIKIDNDKDISVDCPTELLLPYDYKGLMEPIDCKKCGLTHMSTRCLFMDNCPHNKQKNIIEIPKDWVLKDDNGNVINTMKIVLEKKKVTYPKTYEECCKIMKIHSSYELELSGRATTQGEITNCAYIQNLLKKINKFQKLYICRDAYWKIAGDEMGLGKPWEPDYNDLNSTTYGLYDELKYSIINPAQFVFPSKEMRDAFKKNFDPDIEFCKKLL